jgi:predicted phosphate transport protein (TIGR00153 family)
MAAAVVEETAPATLDSLRIAVGDAENAADISLRAMIDSLSDGSYLPSTREDLISIATSCDKIANKCEDVSKLIVLFKLNLPTQFANDIKEIFSITEQQFAKLEGAIDMLFSNMNALQKNHAVLDEIRALETKVDVIEYSVSQRIFDMDIELAAKMQLFDLIDLFCDISDVIENIADKIQIMLIARKA